MNQAMLNDRRPVTVLRVGDAWLVGVEKRAPHGFQGRSLTGPLFLRLKIHSANGGSPNI